MRRTGWTITALAALAWLANGCSTKGEESHPHDHEPWAVTSWGKRYEIFAEADPLAVGETAKSHTHVTILDGFAALTEGVVSAVLIDSTGASSVFTQPKALRPGIYSIEIKPKTEGVFALVFRIESAAGTEEIPSGRVQVGSHDRPGGLVEAPPPPAVTSAAAATGGDPVGFLKEQQWRIPFMTAWAEPGSLRASVSGPARIRPAAGGEAVLTAPLDGVVVPSRRLHVGLAVARGGTVVELRPRAGSGRSFAEIESQWKLASDRLARLEELFAADAVSRAELDRARALAATLRSELDAVSGTGRTIPVRAPFGGRIAEVMITPGAAVVAGASLVRLVQTDPLWVEIGLRPEIAGSLDTAPVGLVIQGGPEQPPVVFESRSMRLVSRSPEVDRATGLVQAIVEVRGAGELRVGAAVQAEILLSGARIGIVIPRESIVDDAGVTVVYVQSEGESFVRREVRILGRQGDHVMVEGVGPADRIVTRGAAAVRRSAQMSSGEVEGHVH
ncbi:MAG: efflux RND transporter periplasmic adaptor subunit [Candidatus Eisenbacteria bacterium]|uniref:Efflux RND transporter periplasmic adaptor subunit n=1 Tax=Eiseniibacteriota bacterium TaxID=2212470 RepID=A0A849SEG3_UNCEI|nr:efflux RND transporter periplasmic adaptor subunit [Candidatus Eisenbacteria bacterium]